jgi:hypothetical protein
MIDETIIESRLRRGIAAIGARQIKQRLRSACIEHGVDYEWAPGKREPISLLPVPVALSRPQLRFLHRLSETINIYLRRMMQIYPDDAALRAIMPFPDEEMQWIEACKTDAPQVVVSRNDFDMPADPQHTVAFEANGCSIGGIYYAGAGIRVIQREVLSRPEFQPAGLVPLTDPCEVLFDILVRHARSLGVRSRICLGILENRDWTIGITEMGSIERFMKARGIPCVIGDPRDLEVRPLRLAGHPVDLLYRNMELSDFIELEREGHDLKAMRQVFRNNRVISGLAGDFDHKSLWEVLTSRATRHVVEPKHRALFMKHLLWTRLLRDTRTEGPDGATIDLLSYTRTHQRKLVLKPNRACGGDGVTIGPLLTARAWNRAVERALADPDTWVVQRFHRGTQKHFLQKPGNRAPYFVTYGIISSPGDFGVVGRACKKPVVNVSVGGGLVAVMRQF